MADEMIYETTIANYESVIGALPENTPDTPYTVRITDIENLTTSNLRFAISNVGRYVNIKWSENSVWVGTNALYMFYGCTELKEIDTSGFTKVTNASYMFYGCTGLTEIDTSPFTRVNSASSMFEGCTGLTDIYITNKVSSAVKTQVASLENITQHWTVWTTIANYETELTATQENTVDNPYDVIIEDIESIKLNIVTTNLGDAIENASRYVNIKWGKYSIYKDTDAHLLFNGCRKLVTVDTSPFIHITIARDMFSNCDSLKEIDTVPFSKVVDAQSMFYGCSSLKSVDCSNFKSVTNITTMFAWCGRLTTIKSPYFYNVTNTKAIFNNCVSLAFVDLSSLENIISIEGDLFYNIKNFTVYNCNSNEILNNYLATLENANVIDTIETTIDDYEQNVSRLSFTDADIPHNVMITDPENISYEIKEGTEDVRVWNINSVIENTGRYVNISFPEDSEWAGTDGSLMFANNQHIVSCDSSPFGNIENARYMFASMPKLLMVNTEKFINVKNAYGMFGASMKLKSIDTSSFYNAQDIERMFYHCFALEELDITPFVSVQNSNKFVYAEITKVIITSLKNPINDSIAESLVSLDNTIKFADDIKFSTLR